MEVFLFEELTARAGDGETVPAGLLAEGRAMRQALERDLSPHVRVRTQDNTDETLFNANAAFCDATIVIAPETGGILLDRAETVLAQGGKLFGPGVELIRLAGDKLATQLALQERVPMPILLDKSSRDYPQVWKPRDGAGSENTFYVDSPTSAQALELLGHRQLLRQLFIEGEPVSLAFLCSPHDFQPLWPCRMHISSDDCLKYLGGELIRDENLAERALALGQKVMRSLHGRFPCVGYLGLDLILGEDEFDYLLEINPRLTTSYVGLSEASGHKLGEWLLAAWHGRPYTPQWDLSTPAWKV